MTVWNTSKYGLNENIVCRDTKIDVLDEGGLKTITLKCMVQVAKLTYSRDDNEGLN